MGSAQLSTVLIIYYSCISHQTLVLIRCFYSLVQHQPLDVRQILLSTLSFDSDIMESFAADKAQTKVPLITQLHLLSPVVFNHLFLQSWRCWFGADFLRRATMLFVLDGSLALLCLCRKKNDIKSHTTAVSPIIYLLLSSEQQSRRESFFVGTWSSKCTRVHCTLRKWWNPLGICAAAGMWCVWGR